MSSRYTTSKAPKLQDCRRHGTNTDNELFLVEGDSAASNVSRVRDTELQAVLPMQGKPMNAGKSSPARVQANQWFKAFIAAAGCGIGKNCRPEQLRYQRIMLLFDPDADGIHCGALLLIFLHHYMPALLRQEKIWMVRAPLLRVTAPSLSEPIYASSEMQYQHLMKQLTARQVGQIQTLRYRGLGSLEADLLTDRCVSRKTRQADLMSERDAQMALTVFGG
ncbi:MAG: toprim domain-containing protein [Burkholderiaceae bacterium]